MPFETLEESRTKGAPITLFLFNYGTEPNAYFAYTDAEQPVTDSNSILYAPIPMSRGNITTNGTLDKTALQVRLPHDCEVSELFKVFPPAHVVTLRIFQGHADDPDGQFLAIWTGRVIACSREGIEAVLACEPVSTSLRRPGLRRNYQFGCPHVLYADDCRASMVAATVPGSVLSVANYVVTLAPGWVDPALTGQFVNGVLRWSGSSGVEVRTILRIDGGVALSLSGPPNELVSGSSVEVVRGCNHQMSDCETVHNNIQNFGGDGWIPIKNPLGLVNNFY